MIQRILVGLAVVIALAVLIFAGEKEARAESTRHKTTGQYLNSAAETDVDTTGAGAHIIHYFAEAAQETTTTAANRHRFHNITVHNQDSIQMVLHLYTPASPIWSEPFDAHPDSDWVRVRIPSTTSLTLNGLEIHGWSLRTVPTSPKVFYIVGWD